MAQSDSRLDWRRVGGSAVEVDLASPATGPMDRVWFSADGSRLFARTRSGRTFESVDDEKWSEVAGAVPPEAANAAVERLPARDVRIRRAVSGKVYGLGSQLYASEDGGRTWVNLTAVGSDSVIGGRQRDVAVSPRDPNLLAVANDFGVWRSVDGGLSWTGINQFLPNLAVRRIQGTPNGSRGARILIEGVGVAEYHPWFGPDWHLTRDAAATADLEQELLARRALSARLSAEITAVAGSGDIRYAGAADGRIWVSRDRGGSWQLAPIASTRPVSGAIEHIEVDSQDARIAVAAAGGSGAHVLRTTNAGVFFDDITSNLPDAAAHGIAMDRAGRAVYAATDRGVFLSRVDLDSAGPASAWTLLSGNLPVSAAMDVKLDPAGNQLFVALDGHGVFATAAPHRAGVLRLVSAADWSARPAAPGSLVSVLGGRIDAARGGDLRFPVLAASEGESQIQVPFEAPAGTSPMALDRAGRTTTLPLAVQNTSPAIFIDRDGAPMLLDADNGLMLDAKNTAKSGARIQILATGLGRVRPDWPTGLAAPLERPPEVRAEVVAYLDRTPLPVTRATLAPGYVGFYLIELQLPPIVNAGPAELLISADGQESNRVRIFLEQ